MERAFQLGHGIDTSPLVDVILPELFIPIPLASLSDSYPLPSVGPTPHPSETIMVHPIRLAGDDDHDGHVARTRRFPTGMASGGCAFVVAFGDCVYWERVVWVFSGGCGHVGWGEDGNGQGRGEGVGEGGMEWVVLGVVGEIIRCIDRNLK